MGSSEPAAAPAAKSDVEIARENMRKKLAAKKNGKKKPVVVEEVLFKFKDTYTIFK